jgi:DNA-binding beta-propeller fold protein YncE
MRKTMKPRCSLVRSGAVAFLALLAPGFGVGLYAGTLAFQPKTDYPAGAYPSEVAVADVNGDGKPDLMVANEFGNTLSVLLGEGDGSFRPKADYPVGPYPHGIAVGDVNGDGKPDLIAPNYADGTVSV